MEPNVTRARHAEARDLLGAFALGVVDAEEAAVVRRHLITCAECRTEIAQLWAMVDLLWATVEPLDPPPALRERLAVAVMAEPAPASPAPAAPVRANPTSPLTSTSIARAPVPIKLLPAFWSQATPWMAAATILLLLSAGLLVWNLQLREQVVEAPGAEVIALAQTNAAPDASGEVIPLPEDHVLILTVRDLPPLASGQVYEVWLIGDDGVPAPAGVFDEPTAQHAVAADRAQYETLAITAEPGPLGTASPTGKVVATAEL